MVPTPAIEILFDLGLASSLFAADLGLSEVVG
jgi:hypothetical protein